MSDRPRHLTPSNTIYNIAQNAQVGIKPVGSAPDAYRTATFQRATPARFISEPEPGTFLLMRGTDTIVQVKKAFLRTRNNNLLTECESCGNFFNHDWDACKAQMEDDADLPYTFD